jgi:hypothetical protein
MTFDYLQFKLQISSIYLKKSNKYSYLQQYLPFASGMLWHNYLENEQITSTKINHTASA